MLDHYLWFGPQFKVSPLTLLLFLRYWGFDGRKVLGVLRIGSLIHYISSSETLSHTLTGPIIHLARPLHLQLQLTALYQAM